MFFHELIEQGATSCGPWARFRMSLGKLHALLSVTGNTLPKEPSNKDLWSSQDLAVNVSFIHTQTLVLGW